MPGRQAKVLSESAVRRMLRLAARSSTPERDRVIVLLSVRAGLRACEIARLDWSMALDGRGRLMPALELQDRAAKRGSGRRIPLHPELKAALEGLLRTERRMSGPIVLSARGGALKPNSLVNWFVVLFRETGIAGGSSHSGRRTFITMAARQAHRVGATLRDVQILAGHRSIETTQRYIEGDTDAQRRLVRGL